jgi:hypothetical protein
MNRINFLLSSPGLLAVLRCARLPADRRPALLASWMPPASPSSAPPVVQGHHFDVAGCYMGRPGLPRMLTTWR